MAVTTHVNTTTSTLNTTFYPSTSFTPPANGYLVVAVAVAGTAPTAPTLTGSGNGLTFARHPTEANSIESLGQHLFLFFANQKTPGSPVAMTVTFGWASGAAAGAIIMVESTTAMTRFGTGANGAVRQVGKVDDVPGGTAPTVPLAVPVLTTNPTIFVHVGNAVGVLPPTGWTEQADVSITTPVMDASIHTRDSGFTGTSIALASGFNGSCAALAVELDASAAVTVYTAIGTIPVTSTLVGNATRTAPTPITGHVTVVSALSGNPTRKILNPAASGTIEILHGQEGFATLRASLTWGDIGEWDSLLTWEGHAPQSAGSVAAVSSVVGAATAIVATFPLSAIGAVTIVSTLTGSVIQPAGASGVVTVVTGVNGEPTAPSSTLVRLVLDVGRDDHPRPQVPLWSRYHYQPTQLALMLFMDGTVIPTWSLDRPEFLTCDTVAAGGRDSIYRTDAWEVAVLTAAGYTLEMVT